MIESLPEAVAHAIRLASVPAHLRALFANLPVTVRVEAELPADAAAIGSAARQIVKLASLGGRVQLVRATCGGSGAFVSMAARDREVRIDAGDADDVSAVAMRALERLLEPSQLAAALDSFARRSASLAALHTLTRRMLLTPDVDRALEALLAGVTAGAGLAFHRAALFLWDDGARAFAGTKAVGPADEQEAHRIWEAIEYAGASSLEEIIDADRDRDRRFEAFVRTLSLRDGGDPDDEVAAATASAVPVLFARERPFNPGLKRLRASREFVLAGLRARGELRALLYADNLYGRDPIEPARVDLLGIFLDQVALVWDNLALLARIEQLARFDALTGVHNRRAFEERLREEHSRCQRDGAPCSLVLVDVDLFKQVNDSRGHGAGDDVLRTLATLLRSGARAHDVVARIGGDEFAIVLPGADRQVAMAAGLRFGRAAKTEHISVSMGGATWPDDCATPSLLLTNADTMLYTAKRAGRGRGVFGEGHEVRF